MRSKQRLEANRANAKRSTGPTTASGKARAKMNALKHGLSAKAVVIEGENSREFDALRAGLERDFEPATVIERELVENLAALLWRQRRGHRFEAAIFQRILGDVLYDDDDKTREIANELIGDDILTKLARYEMNLANRIDRTINQLDRLRASRLEAGEAMRLIESTLRPQEKSADNNSGDNSAAIAATEPGSED
jgi:hypothetical protein